ncbi:alginate lyase family protein [Pseudonocardia xishanensis]|uniref:heparinase II/III family protein n=1 Tax=Pseudonocardia xishanensis TaxID=630995 RepID=UPI0031E77157
MTGPGWYLRRLSKMGPREVGDRLRTAVRQRAWRRRVDHAPDPGEWLGERTFAGVLPRDALASVTPEAEAALRRTADRLMAGEAEFFGVRRSDMVLPDWSWDPKTGRRAPTDVYTADVPYRDEDVVGDVKQLWEPSRHQYLTVLAAAYAMTGEDHYAERVADHLRSWWRANPPLRGVHWLSGIELGIRLLSWVWVRRLLDGWSGAAALFEDDPVAVNQILLHQRRLAAFPSRGSSANNHAVAEWAGLLAAACTFPWYPESARWRAEAVAELDAVLRNNTFPSGVNRELASDYHGLVLELGLAATAEASRAGVEVPESTWDVLVRMSDALAAMVDCRGRPPRQGDSDDGVGLVLDGDDVARWPSLLGTAGEVFGRLPWWPESAPRDVRTAALTALLGRREPDDRRPARRPYELADAGLTILRAPESASGPELWCRCDAGPHGFLSIAAHAHADALAIEVRHGGIDLLADPGTYCYHGEPDWRRYFRSTLGHNTLEVEGRDQSASGGPFLWTRHASSRVLGSSDGADRAHWCAEHTGYGRDAVHRRTVDLDVGSRVLTVSDVLVSDRERPCRLAFHLGPEVRARFEGTSALLTHPAGEAVLQLPPELDWAAHRGSVSPPLGWYSVGFGSREPTVTLVGTGWLGGARKTVRTTLHVDPEQGPGAGRSLGGPPRPHLATVSTRPVRSLPTPEPRQTVHGISVPSQTKCSPSRDGT